VSFGEGDRLMLIDVNPRVYTLELSETHGKFAIEPLEGGFGHTIGNALRRVLLAFVPGAAVTSVNIDGALHEFSTLPGVVEDTTEIVLNLKELAIRLEGVENWSKVEPRKMLLDVRGGPAEVTAADIQAPPDITIVNPEHHIAELANKNASLHIEMTVEAGHGYRRLESSDGSSHPIGTIMLDPIFTPVRRVAYRVEPTRVGPWTNLDRLMIDVDTNGSIAPNDALSTAAKLLGEYIAVLFDFTEREEREKEAIDEEQEIRREIFKYRIEDLDFSVRTYNCLKKEGINTLGELVQRTEADLMNIRNFGKRSLAEVIEKLEQYELALKEPPDEVEDALEDDGTTLSVSEAESL